MKASLKSDDGTILVKRLRAEHCNLEAKGFQASSLESLNLYVKAGLQGFHITKRLGLNTNANIVSEGPVKISSLFCMMRNLPLPSADLVNKVGAKLLVENDVEIALFHHLLGTKLTSIQTLKLQFLIDFVTNKLSIDKSYL